MDIVNNWIKEKQEQTGKFVIPAYRCDDGFTISIQASDTHYCTPRRNNAFPYSKVELGYPSEEEELLLSYAEDPLTPLDTVYAYVPVTTVLRIINTHNTNTNPSKIGFDINEM